MEGCRVARGSASRGKSGMSVREGSEGVGGSVTSRPDLLNS